jgi:hypothetical protein
LWRSHRQFPSPLGVGALQVGSHAVAFSYDNTLFLSPLGGAERPTAPGEFPLGFTRGGLYTYRWDRALLLRSEAGALLKTIARWPFDADMQVDGGTLDLIAHHSVMRARSAGAAAHLASAAWTVSRPVALACHGGPR